MESSIVKLERQRGEARTETRMHLTLVCMTVTTPGLSCEIMGEWPAVTPYSPSSPGRITLSTTLSEKMGAYGVQKLITKEADEGAASAANVRRTEAV